MSKASLAAAEEGGKLDTIHNNILQQVGAGTALCKLISDADFNECSVGICELFHNIFTHLNRTCGEIDALLVEMERGKAA
jgi:hypothetical protein